MKWGLYPRGTEPWGSCAVMNMVSETIPALSQALADSKATFLEQTAHLCEFTASLPCHAV